MSIWCKLGMHDWNTSGCKCKRTFCEKKRHQMERISDCKERCIKCGEITEHHKWVETNSKNCKEGDNFIFGDDVRVLRCTVCNTELSTRSKLQYPQPQEIEPQEEADPNDYDENGHFPNGGCSPHFYSGWH